VLFSHKPKGSDRLCLMLGGGGYPQHHTDLSNI